MRVEEAVDSIVDAHLARPYAAQIAASLVDPEHAPTVNAGLPVTVGITGYARHGKDTVGKHFEEKGYTKFAFADALKSIALVLDPVVGYVPNVVTDVPYLEQRLAKLVEDLGWESAKTYPEVRRFLQVLGTEGVRGHLGDDSWVRALEKSVAESRAKSVVVTDVRFPNEAKWIHSRGGTLIRVVRRNPDGSPFDNGVSREHASERFVSTLPADLEITASNLDQLTLLANAAVEQVSFGTFERQS